MIYNPKFIFFHMTKTGGSSMDMFLQNQIEGSIRPVLIGEYLKPEIEERVAQSRHEPAYRIRVGKELMIGYIRNPYDWYVSLWSWAKWQTPPAYLHFFRHSPFSDRRLNEFINGIHLSEDQISYNTGGLPMESMKNDFTDIDMKLANKLDIGLLTYKYLYMFHDPAVFKDVENHKDYLLLDRVLRFENLIDGFFTWYNDNFERLEEEQKKMFPHVKESSHNHYSTYYDDSLINLIRHKDRIIFDTYGYQFERK